MLEPAEDFQIQVREDNGKKVPLTRLGNRMDPFSSDPNSVARMQGVSRERFVVEPVKEVHHYYQLTTTFDMTVSGAYIIAVSRRLIGGQLAVAKPLHVYLEPEPVAPDPNIDKPPTVSGNGVISRGGD